MNTESLEIDCPTCNARQGLSEECRRCKCDLTLVSAAVRQCLALEQECTIQLRRGEFARALAAARKRWALVPDSVAAKYLAVCYTLLGRYQAALDVANTLSSSGFGSQ